MFAGSQKLKELEAFFNDYFQEEKNGDDDCKVSFFQQDSVKYE